MASLILATAHGLVAGDRFYFGNMFPEDAGPVEGDIYYVLAAGLTADAFEFSETDGGTPFVLTSDITECVLSKAAVYTDVTDPDDVMAPPEAPDPPTDLSLDSSSQLDADGHALIRLTVQLTQPTNATLRHTVVTIESEGGGDPTYQVVIPKGQTMAAIDGVIGGYDYQAYAVAYDTFGLASDQTDVVLQTSATDTTAPGQVTGLAAFGAILGLICTWTASTAADLSHYEVQIDDSNTFPSPDVYKIKSNVFALQQIAVGTYYFRVRAIDLTGNAGTYSSTVSAVSRTVQTADLTDALITTAKLVAGAVTDVELASAAVTAAKIAVDAVTAPAIAAGAVGTSEIDALAVTSAKLAALAVTTAKLDASAVTTAKIAADAVTAAEIATGAVGSTELAAGAVIAGKITAGTIVAADIAAGTITGAKIAAGTITASNILADTITANEIATDAITASEISALAVTTAKLAAGAVTAAKITAGTITTTEIAALTIVAANIAAGTITAAKIAAGTITATEIAALTIVAANIAAGTITGAKIAAATITASNIVADTITANEIAASAITSSELAAGAVTAGKITAGTIVTGDLNALCSIQLVSNSGATVVIDATGITVTNGLISISDKFGTTALDGYGFGPSWMRFIRTGVYNSDFAAGDTSDIAITEVSGAASIANYKASTTTHLPAWVVAASDSTLKKTSDSNASAGFTLESLQTAANQTTRFYQDVPVVPGAQYVLRFNWRYTVTGVTDFALNTYYSARDKDHALIGSRVGGGLTYSTTKASYFNQRDGLPGVGAMPSNAVYLRVEIEIVHNAFTAVTKLTDVFISDITVQPRKTPTVNAYTVTSTWTKPADLAYAVIEVVGSGGGGGGVSVSGVGENGVGAGGGGGGYARLVIDASSAGATEAVTVGAGGTAGSTSGGNGGTGGTVSFGSWVSCTGGTGGGGATPGTGTVRTTGGTGSTPAGGDINVAGSDGLNGTVIAGVYHGNSGYGGAAAGAFGGGAAKVGQTGGGNVGNLYGGGGTGATLGASTAGRAGGAGGKGIVVVTEYYE